uniref:EGF-like domain-containing protein n=1 Tax=Myotis myotis TaxID=51298 RepID=A0A7J8ALV7_MYOMY|nr:hypothetical protein mMyoMyo1_007867 [Myotis myotis]
MTATCEQLARWSAEWRGQEHGLWGTMAHVCSPGLLSTSCVTLEATTTQSKWNDYFSPCPKKYEHYCINGKCRFVGALQTPSCLCDDGYAGARCERVDFFYLRGDTGQILVICLTAVMVTLIILVIGVCTCCHPLRRKKKEDMPNLGKDITPVNEDIQETSIA